MIDSIKIEFEQEAKTVLGIGKATASNFFFIAGYSMETLLHYEQEYNDAVKKCVNHMLTANRSGIHMDELTISTTGEVNNWYTENVLYRVLCIDGELFSIDMTQENRHKEKTDKKTVLEYMKNLYREQMISADHESRKAS
jgi:hypothetical protein